MTTPPSYHINYKTNKLLSTRSSNSQREWQYQEAGLHTCHPRTLAKRFYPKVQATSTQILPQIRQKSWRLATRFMRLRLFWPSAQSRQPSVKRTNIQQMKSPIPLQIKMPSTIRGTSKMEANNPNTAPSPILSLTEHILEKNGSLMVAMPAQQRVPDSQRFLSSSIHSKSGSSERD